MTRAMPLWMYGSTTGSLGQQQQQRRRQQQQLSHTSKKMPWQDLATTRQ
jgi:hypothetical protein